jgi:hypothetical protein
MRIGVLALLATAVSVPSLHAQNNNDQGASGASYLTTVKTSIGTFASRGVITLHADHTMSVIDSGQGGPFFFSSQLGSWKPANGGVVARTIDFNFPPNAAVARLDYTISFSQDLNQVTGTITLTAFPLQGNPLDGGGTLVGTFTFTGQLIKP